MIITVTSLLLTIMKSKNGYFSMDLIFENYVKVWGIYCQQGLPEFPRELPMQLASFSIYISSIVTLATYSASLIRFLALNFPKLPFSTLEDFVNDGNYKLITVQNSSGSEVPSNVKDPVFLKMYELLEEKKYLPASAREGFEQICQRKNLAFYMSEVIRESMDMYIQCNIVYIDTGRIQNIALMLSKGNPYIGFINYHLQRFQTNGVMNKLRNKYLPKKSPNKMTYSTIDMNNVTPVLTIMVGSMFLALFILIIEKMYYSFKTLFKKNKLSVEKLSHNLGVKNKLQKKNDERNLQL
ncbi:PREDICTED: uncharacterized protein LOC105458277 [Wasmannia auropunctata]|uniref:uncharacterized protein LOC105458277 n=1 Tax=Wasmannia auropunctata TaxID=64793 RepID=UPI0005F0717E|nr:PREDICTED: uncharacterized protein LOC105458277 [Wasmannia auropunctata]